MKCRKCSDYLKKCTYANTALGFQATRQSTIGMREGGNVENIAQNIITVHSRSLVVVVVSSSEKFKNSLLTGAHSPTFPLLHLHHSSFSNPSVASPMSQLILQSFFRFSYITASSLTSPGKPPMVCLAVVNGYFVYTEYIDLTCIVFMLFTHKLHYK